MFSYFLGLLDLDILSIRNSKGCSCVIWNSSSFITSNLNFVHYDYSHIEHVHPIFCAHLIKILGVLNLNIISSTPPLDTGGNVVRGNRTVMQMKSLRDHPDMSYGSNKQWNQLCEKSCFNFFTVLEPNIRKRRMLFPIMSISVQAAKESDVRKFTYNEWYTFSWVRCTHNTILVVAYEGVLFNKCS